MSFVCSDCSGLRELYSPSFLTHLTQLNVEFLQPVEVHVIQVISAHGLSQFFNVHIARLCGVLTPALDILPLSGKQNLFRLLCYYPV